MATHSSIIAWKVPQAEEPCNHGVQKIGHNTATKTMTIYTTAFNIFIHRAFSASRIINLRQIPRRGIPGSRYASGHLKVLQIAMFLSKAIGLNCY